MKSALQLLADYDQQRFEWFGPFDKTYKMTWTETYMDVVADVFRESFFDEWKDYGMPIESVNEMREIRSLMRELGKDYGIMDDAVAEQVINDSRCDRIRKLSANLLKEIEKLPLPQE